VSVLAIIVPLELAGCQLNRDGHAEELAILDVVLRILDRCTTFMGF
jgi:hypothetical protein